MSNTTTSNSQNQDESSWTLLLEPYYGDYHTPHFWQSGKKSRNYFAIITPGTKYPFQRKFLSSLKLDDQVVFRATDFQENQIVEQKSVFVKGSKSETTFHGFFIIHHTPEGIKGEEMSQKEALQYFDLQEQLPDIEEPNTAKNKLRVKMGTVVRKLSRKYGDEMIVEILTEILNDYFPDSK